MFYTFPAKYIATNKNPNNLYEIILIIESKIYLLINISDWYLVSFVCWLYIGITYIKNPIVF